MKKYLEKLYCKAVELNHANIFDLLCPDAGARFVDLGCDDGHLTMNMAAKITTKNVWGVEIVEERVSLAQEKGIMVEKIDLNKKFVFESESFDVVNANQVIEHISDSDIFIGEIYRILNKGGYAVISTENASSWCNVIASIFGWQIFSLTNFSGRKQGIGNPFSLHRNAESGFYSWNHVRIYNIRGLKEYFEVFGFKVEAIRGAGYFPFPAWLGKIDKTHCHFMTFKIRKY